MKGAGQGNRAGHGYMRVVVCHGAAGPGVVSGCSKVGWWPVATRPDWGWHRAIAGQGSDGLGAVR